MNERDFNTLRRSAESKLIAAEEVYKSVIRSSFNPDIYKDE